MRSAAISTAKNGDLNRALADYNQAVAVDPGNPDQLEERGRFYSRKGEFDAAITNFTEAIRLCPTNAWHYVTRAGIYEEAAAADAKRGDLSPSSPVN
jgi:tetratricopeptide (TPR) repeat protein